MTITSQKPNSTVPVASPPLPTLEAYAMLARLKAREPGAALAANRLADDIEARPLAIGFPRAKNNEERDDTLRAFGTLAEELRAAVASLDDAEPQTMLAKAQLVARWPDEGEPPYARDLTRTLCAGLLRLAEGAPRLLGVEDEGGTRHD